MHTPILSLSEVSFSYFTETEQTPAVSHLNLSILPGEFAAIVGPSGCGKTSVLSLIMGLLRPQAGTITFADPNLRIGYMLQRDHLLEWRTVEKNVLLGLEVQHRKTERTRANALRLLDAYGLGAFKAYYPQQLSGGMRHLRSNRICCCLTSRFPRSIIRRGCSCPTRSTGSSASRRRPRS